MSSKYTVVIIQDNRIAANKLHKILMHKAFVYIAALPEKYFNVLTKAVDKIQDEAAEEGEL